jgi:hypothetical protein
VSVLDPHSFVCELWPVNALITGAIWLGNLASLHHEVRDHSLDLAAFVMFVATELTRAQLGKVFASLRHQILKDFDHIDALRMALLARLTNSNFNPALVVVHAKLGHRSK